jgi:hypothetical protein
VFIIKNKLRSFTFKKILQCWLLVSNRSTLTFKHYLSTSDFQFSLTCSLLALSVRHIEILGSWDSKSAGNWVWWGYCDWSLNRTQRTRWARLQVHIPVVHLCYTCLHATLKKHIFTSHTDPHTCTLTIIYCYLIALTALLPLAVLNNFSYCKNSH